MILDELTCIECTIEYCEKCKTKSIYEKCENNLIWQNEGC